MLKLMVANQKGGVAKTTTAITLARCYADRGLRTLLVDSDPQSSVAMILKQKPANYLSDFILKQLRLQDCAVKMAENLDVLFGNRETVIMEQRINTEWGREFVYQKAFMPYERDYDVAIVDVAPSISLLQACSMVFCENVLIPISMDTLSVSGAVATISSAQTISASVRAPIRMLAILPTMVNRRYGLTDQAMAMIQSISGTHSIPVLDQIRTDQSIGRAARDHMMLVDADPKSKAWEDYDVASKAILKLLQTDSFVQGNGHAVNTSA